MRSFVLIGLVVLGLAGCRSSQPETLPTIRQGAAEESSWLGVKKSSFRPWTNDQSTQMRLEGPQKGLTPSLGN